MVELSALERLMLTNQFRILQKLDPGEAEYYHLPEKIEILKGGFESEYARVLGGFLDPTLPAEECRLVVDVMTLTTRLLDHADTTNPALKAELERIAIVEFDANNEGEHLSYAQFLFNHPHTNYPGIRNVVNSHHSTLSRHRQMVDTWKQLGGGGFSEEDAARLLRIDLAANPDAEQD